jgi:hypothetical protein
LHLESGERGRGRAPGHRLQDEMVGEGRPDEEEEQGRDRGREGDVPAVMPGQRVRPGAPARHGQRRRARPPAQPAEQGEAEDGQKEGEGGHLESPSLRAGKD